MTAITPVLLLACLSATARAPAELAGKIVLISADGSRGVPREGRFELWLLGEDGFTRQEVAVLRGAWRAGLAPGTRRAEIGRMWLEGEQAWSAAVLEEPREGATFEIEARVVPRVVLRARGEQPGEEPERIEIVAEDQLGEGVSFPVRPGESAPNPAVLSPFGAGTAEDHGFHRKREWWVRAPGYAWARISIDHDRAGEHALALGPAGTIRVEVRGDLPRQELELRLLRGQHATRGSRLELEPEGPTVIEGLAPGWYGVQLLRRREQGEPEGMGLQHVRVRANRTAEASFASR